MSLLRAGIPLGLMLGLALALPTASHATEYCGYGTPPAAADDEVVLPSRIQIAINRTERSICKAEEHVDEGQYAKTTVSLRSERRNMYRAYRAAVKQMNAVPDPNAEEGSIPGPDAVIADLNMDSDVVTSVAGLFGSPTLGTHQVVDNLGVSQRRATVR